MSEVKLKPCPFCGGKSAFMLQNERLTINCEVKRYGFVMCVKCGMQQGETLTENEAIEAWNRRKPMDDILERLEEFYDENEFEINSGYIETCIDIVKGGVED